MCRGTTANGGGGCDDAARIKSHAVIQRKGGSACSKLISHKIQFNGSPLKDLFVIHQIAQISKDDVSANCSQHLLALALQYANNMVRWLIHLNR